MKPHPDSAELTPHELALLACYQDGALAPEDLLEAERLLERSETAREIIAETSELLGRDPGETTGSVETEPTDSAAGEAPAPEPRSSTPRMGWRTFLPLAAAGVAGVLLFWPGGETLNLVSWSDSLVRQGGSEAFVFPISRGEAMVEDIAEAAGIRWVDLRVALRGGRSEEADSLAGVLSSSLASVAGSGPARGRIEALIGRTPLPPVEELEAVQRALMDLLNGPFEEAAVLETLRRAADAGASSLAAQLVGHSSLDDGSGEDIDPATRARLFELCENDLTSDELAEMEAIVTEVLRQRT